MADLPMIQLVTSKGQDTIGDCGICALATVCGRSYEDVVAMAVQYMGEHWKGGLYLTHILAIAKACGTTLKRRRKYDLEHDTGILNCWVTTHIPNKKPSTDNHVVVLMEGRIYDSDGRIWVTDAFQQHYAAEFGLLLEVV